MPNIFIRRFDTTNTYAIEKQAVALGYASSAQAWEAAVAGYPSNSMVHTNYFYDNAGWVKGLLQTGDGKWGGYIWLLQNTVNFKTSASNIWVSTNGVANVISKVLVGTIGDYAPMTDEEDTGPGIAGLTNWPIGGSSNDVSYTADFTAYYDIGLPALWVLPLLTNVCINSGNVTFWVITNSYVSNGVTWSIAPEGLTNGAVLTGYATSAVVAVGGVATSYVVRATANENTNIYALAVLNVLKVDIEQAETNACWQTTNVTLNLISANYWDGRSVVWTSTPSGLADVSYTDTEFMFNPSNSTPTTYVVTAWASLLTNCSDVCTVRVVKSEFQLFADQPGAGGDRDTYEVTSLIPLNVDVGHTFWRFNTSHKSILPSFLQPFANEYMGYYPSNSVSPFGNTSAPGWFVKPDTSHVSTYEVDYTWRISLDDLKDGLQFSKNLSDSPGTYDLNTNNCTDAGINAGAAAGVTVPDTTGMWPGGGNGSNPGDLGEDLRALP